MEPEPISLQDADHGSGSSLCFICSKNDERKSFCNNKDVYDHFLNFCVQYLKADIADVSRLRSRGGESVEALPPGFCETCERYVQDTLKVFEDLNDAKSRLLGKVNTLGLMISERSKGDTDSDIVESFMKQLENKCFTKSQIIHPSVKLVVEVEEYKKVKQELSGELDDDDDGDPSFVPSQSKKRKRNVQRKGKTRKSVRVIRLPKRFELKTEEELSLNSHPPEDVSFHDLDDSYEPEVMSVKKERTDKKIPNKRPKPKSSSLLTRSSNKTSYSSFKFKCSECNYKVRHRDKFFEHNLVAHEGIEFSKFLECKICQEKMKDLASLVDHLKSMHETPDNKPIFCFQCSESFTTKQLCELHSRLDHSRSSHILCEVEDCKGKFISSLDYYQHLKTHCNTNDLIYSCEECERTFLGLYQCELHKFYHCSKNGEGVYTCPIEQCQKGNKYRNIDKLVNHYNQQHIPKECQLKLHQCDQCKTAPYFIFKKDLLLHLKGHAREYTCQLCKEKFAGYNALSVHHFNQHPDVFKGNLVETQRQTAQTQLPEPDANVYKHSNIVEVKVDANNDTIDTGDIKLHRQCAYCEKIFPTFSEMEKHKVKDHKIKIGTRKVQVQCEICGLSLLRAQLNRHMICHKEPHMPCPYPRCTKKFRREENLNMHVKSVHDRKESDREFICDTCGRRYLTQGLLNRHAKERHTKPFACHLCPKTFSTVYKINEHLRAAHTNEKFQCKWCPSEFSWLCKLKFHAKKKHPDQAHLISSIYNYAMKPKAVQYTGLTIYDKYSTPELAT